MLKMKTTHKHLFLLFALLLSGFCGWGQSCAISNPAHNMFTDGVSITDIGQSFVMNCPVDGTINSIRVFSMNTLNADLYIYEGNGFGDPTPYQETGVSISQPATTIVLSTPYSFIKGQAYTFRFVAAGGGAFALCKISGANPYPNGNLYENGSNLMADDLYFIVESSNIMLPVELTHFSAKPKGNIAHLTWQTATETNNEGFEIQRSPDGQNWEKIGFVEGAGNSQQEQSYAFEDPRPYQGRSYYRLKQIDFDGAFEYSDIESLRMVSDLGDSHLTVFPNPVASGQEMQVYTSLEKTAGNTITLFNGWGKALSTYTLTDSALTIAPSAFNQAPGMYVLVLRDQAGVVLEKKKVLIVR